MSTSSPTQRRKGQQAKRPRTSPPRAGNRARILGRLSKLLDMPVDILLEIFGHLPPSDLLTLSRVNRNFLNLLSGPGSSSFWNTSFRLVGAPIAPSDMSPTAWARLLFGGSYCYSCGAKPVTRILFSLRRRACKVCMTAHLLCSSKVPQEFRDLIRSDSGISGSMIHHTRSTETCTAHWWDNDVAALSAEWIERQNASNKEAAIAEFQATKKEEVAAIKKHALICAAWEKDRSTCRTNELSDVRERRFEYIKAQLLLLGYSDEDVNQLRRHPDVRISKPMSDRVWQRIQPLLLPGANEARDQRLLRDGGDNYRLRRRLAIVEYATFLGTLPPIFRALAPTLKGFLCQNQAVADALAFGDGSDPQLVTERTIEATGRLRPALKQRMRDRARLLRSLLPKTDISEDATDDEALSLATSVYECTGCRVPATGLHMLVHKCDDDDAQNLNTIHPQLSEEGRKTVVMLLEVLGLGKNTTALELDRRNDKFVCMCCSRGIHPEYGEDVVGRTVRDWRSCVTYSVRTKYGRWPHKRPQWHWIGSTPIDGLSHEHFLGTLAYGCLRCPLRIDLNSGSIQWHSTVRDITQHIRDRHGKNEPLEGEDFFFDFGLRRSGYMALLTVD